MPQHRDPRYRGRTRRAAPPKRKPGHLRTNYTADDPEYLFHLDMEKVRAVWPEEVIRGDRRAVRRKNLRWIGITSLIVMVPVTVLAVLFVLDQSMPWWIIPVAQSALLLYLLVLWMHNGSLNDGFDTVIHREADRRGIKYDAKQTPHHALMNKINADYNSHLWNRNFKWK